MRSSDSETGKVRLQVYLSRNGVCSRRKAMTVVQEGHVTLNGTVCREPSTPVDVRRDHVSVDGKKIKNRKYDYVLLHKPAGFTTTRQDRHASKTVLDLMPQKYRHLAPAGRLDRDTEGLLLLTNDGDVAYQLTHPRFNLDKTYFVRLLGKLSMDKQKKVERGVFIDGIKTAPAKIKNVRVLKSQTELKITVHEGRKRQIRYMFAKVGHKVIYLKRLSQGPLSLGTLKKGMWRPLSKQEIDTLHAL